MHIAKKIEEKVNPYEELFKKFPGLKVNIIINNNNLKLYTRNILGINFFIILFIKMFFTEYKFTYIFLQPFINTNIEHI